jgi:hypothetical protein
MDRDADDALRLSEQVLFEVLDALADASVDPHERTIIWGDAPASRSKTRREEYMQSLGCHSRRSRLTSSAGWK